MVISAILFSALVASQDTPTFREIEQLKFNALQQLQNGSITWQGTMKSGAEPLVLMKVEVKMKGEILWTQVTANGLKQIVLLSTEQSTMFVSFVDQVYGVYPIDNQYKLRSEQSYTVPNFEQGIEFNIDQFGPAISVGTKTEESLIGFGQEVLDGVEYDWYEHNLKSNSANTNIKQWFKKDTWIIKKMTMIGQSQARGSMTVSVEATDLDTENVVPDSDLIIDPSVYEDMRKLDDAGDDEKYRKPAREGLPAAPSYQEIEQLKIDAMAALKSCKYRYVFVATGSGLSQIQETQGLFRGNQERLTHWTDASKILEQQSSENGWLVVKPELLTYSIEVPTNSKLRSETATKSANVTRLMNVNNMGIHLFTDYVDDSEFLDYGEEKVLDKACVWYEHRVSSGGSVAIVRQWFLKDTWLSIQATVQVNHVVNGELDMRVRMEQFEPDAEVADHELLVDPALYMGYRLISADNPTGLGRDAINSTAPSYQEIDRLKFQALLDLDSGRFVWASKAKAVGEVPGTNIVQYVFRGDEFKVSQSENNELVSENSLSGSSNTNVFHKLRAYIIDAQAERVVRKQNQFTRPEVKPKAMKFRSFTTGVYVFLNKDAAPKLVAMGEEYIDDIQCVWYEHELTFADGGIIVRQWFKKDSWLLFKLEERVIKDGVMVGSISAYALVFEPNAEIEDEDLLIDPKRFEGYMKVDPPVQF